MQFFSDASDESQTFQADVGKELKRLCTWLAEMSYQYNLKVIGMPELSEQESYYQTSAGFVQRLEFLKKSGNL